MTVKLTYKISNNGVIDDEIFAKHFETKDKAWKWVRNQDGHPWLSIRVVDVELQNISELNDERTN